MRTFFIWISVILARSSGFFLPLSKNTQSSMNMNNIEMQTGMAAPPPGTLGMIAPPPRYQPPTENNSTVSEENEGRGNGTMIEKYDEELYEDEEEVEARSVPIPSDPLGRVLYFISN